MATPNRAGDAPVAVELEAGKNYAWCKCGESKNQPFCDGAHKSTNFQPEVFSVDESKTYYLCNCKVTGNDPFCDGSHK